MAAVTFGEFELDEAEHALRLRGEAVPVQPLVLASSAISSATPAAWCRRTSCSMRSGPASTSLRRRCSGP